MIEHPSDTLLARYIDSTLEVDQRVTLERHVESCESCRHLMRELVQMASGVGQPSTEPDAGDDELEPSLPLVKGTPVGRYLLLERLGGGGMGVVYAAFDPALDRKIALKFMRESVEARRAQRIAEGEAKSMARLTHSNVVGVFDVGTLANRTFLAMEYVEGSTLSVWLTESARSARDIGEAFLAAGRGLQAIHAAGLVHGDFKPANVLISTTGQIKVSDFGLARESTRADASLAGAGTARYMAPEQRSGHPADAASDQFSFATALREALARVEPGQLHRRLLAIGARGCEPTPSTRYPSFGRLLHDLERALRPRTVSPLAAALGALALAGAMGLVAYARHTAPCQQLDTLMTDTWATAPRAELAAAFAKSEAPFASSVLSTANRELDAYAAQWVAQRIEACEATHVRQEQSESLLDLRVDCLERRRLELRALVHELERAEKPVVSRAVDMVAGLEPLSRCDDRAALLDRAPRPKNEAARAALEAAWQHIALARATRSAGRFTDKSVAEVALVRANETKEPFLVAEALVLLADFQVGQEVSATSWRALSAAEAGGNEIAKAQSLIKLIEKEVERPPEQRRLAELIELARATVARAGEPPLLSLVLSRGIGSALRKSGKLDEGVEVLRAALLRLAQSPEAVPAHQVGVTWNTLGGALLMAGRNEEAVEALQTAQRLLSTTVGREHPLFAQTEVNLGAALSALNRFDEAASALAHAETVYERSLAKPNSFLPGVLINLAQIDLQLRRPEKGLERSLRAVELYTEASGASSTNVALAQTQVGQALIRLHRPAQAQRVLNEALALYVKNKGADHPELVDTLELLGTAAAEQRDFKTAEQALARALRITGQTGGASRCIMGRASYLLGRVKRLAGHPAPQLFEDAVAQCADQSDGADVVTLSKFELARLASRRNEAQQAAAAYAAMQSAEPELVSEMRLWLEPSAAATARTRPGSPVDPAGK